MNEAINKAISERERDISQLQSVIAQRRELVERESAQLQTDMLNMHRQHAALAQLRQLQADAAAPSTPAEQP